MGASIAGGDRRYRQPTGVVHGIFLLMPRRLPNNELPEASIRLLKEATRVRLHVSTPI
jgi:hypothetical protein